MVIHMNFEILSPEIAIKRDMLYNKNALDSNWFSCGDDEGRRLSVHLLRREKR